MNRYSYSLLRDVLKSFVSEARHQLLGFALAILGTAAMLLVIDALGPDAASKTPIIVFVVPIVLSAYAGGLLPGLLATVLAVVGAVYLILPPLHSWHVENRADVVKVLTLAAVGALVSVLMERTHLRTVQPG